MELRVATADDAAAVQRVATAAWHAAHDDIVGEDAVDEFLAEYYSLDGLREGFEDGNGTTFVATVDDEVVGYAAGVPRDDHLSLAAIYVHPDRQGEGAGSALADRVEQFARREGHDAVRLVVMADNDQAIGFYEARGYEHVADGYDDTLDVANATYEKQL